MLVQEVQFDLLQSVFLHSVHDHVVVFVQQFVANISKFDRGHMTRTNFDRYLMTGNDCPLNQCLSRLELWDDVFHEKHMDVD